MSQISTTEVISRIAQRCVHLSPTIIVGSGASMAHGMPGMADLAQRLVAAVTPLGGPETDAWLLVRTALSEGDHLEAALSKHSCPPELIAKIVEVTWTLISEGEHRIYCDAVLGSFQDALQGLLRLLFASTNRSVDLVTTNYDRLIEFACDGTDYIWSAGFTYGHIRRKVTNPEWSIRRGDQPARIVHVWKVHGSVDWFKRRSDGTLVSASLQSLMPELEPMMVSPGIDKHRQTHSEPFRTIIAGADRALERANAFLCIGYGFRDDHIEPKIIDRVKTHNAPIIVLAKQLTEEAKAFLARHAGNDFLAIEEMNSGSKVFLPDYPDGIPVPNEALWRLDGFINLVN